MTIQEQRFGIEIEFTGITRNKAADVIAEYFATFPRHLGGIYDAYSVPDTTGRAWRVVSDSSISSRATGHVRAGRSYECELVSPICTYEDIKTVQALVRALREEGAISNSSCGIHIHIDGSPHTAQSVRNIVNIISSKEDILYRALNVHLGRETSYCKKTDKAFLDKINQYKPVSLEEVKDLWYEGCPSRSNEHYDNSRYRCLNLHSLFNKGTIEFRCFNSDIQHAGKIRDYIQFCLAVSAQAINQKRAYAHETVSVNECYTFRTWLIRIGLNGKEFESCRLHMLANLNGPKDWKDKEAAMRRREERAYELAQLLTEESNHPEPAVSEPTADTQPVIPLRQQVNEFVQLLESVGAEERARIMDILNGRTQQQTPGDGAAAGIVPAQRGRR
ncbi:MAG: amidoligase family protein [Oscillospiraceae bacterium]